MAYLEISDLINLYYTIDAVNLKELLKLRLNQIKNYMITPW